MEKIIWDSSFSVGIERLDMQHKRIIGQINKLIDCKALVNSEVISEALDELTKYSVEHFHTEEKLLEKYGYPAIDQQKEQHKAYRLKVASLCKKTMLYVDTVPDDLTEFVRDWWKNHILVADMQYKDFFNDKGVH